MSKLIGDSKPDSEALKTMQERGGDWYAYQNHDMGHRDLGRLIFLQCGTGRTFPVPPERMPDTQHSIGWRYFLVGKVDLTDGTVKEIQQTQKEN